MDVAERDPALDGEHPALAVEVDHVVPRPHVDAECVVTIWAGAHE
jgi:hypothetical protein